MNARRLYTIISLLLGVTSVYAQATLKIADFSIKPNETKEISIDMENSVEIRAFQVRVVFPQGITLADVPKLVESRQGGAIDEFGEYVTAQKSLSYNMWSDGSCMLIVNSEDGLPFSGNTGAILTMSIRADESVAGTTGEIKLSDM